MNTQALEGHFLLLQINDSLFPIGAYSHSYGLETYIQQGIIHDEETAATYITNRLRYNFTYTDLLAARLAYDVILVPMAYFVRPMALREMKDWPITYMPKHLVWLRTA